MVVAVVSDTVWSYWQGMWLGDVLLAECRRRRCCIWERDDDRSA